jgi:hypothetical protein
MRYPQYTARTTVTAVQWKGTNLDEVEDFAGDDYLGQHGGQVRVQTVAGPRAAGKNEWLLRGTGPDSTLIVQSEHAFGVFFPPDEAVT